MAFSFSIGRYNIRCGITVVDRRKMPPTLWQVFVWRGCQRGWQSIGRPQPLHGAARLHSWAEKVNPSANVKLVSVT